jgi:hypothetical protein
VQFCQEDGWNLVRSINKGKVDFLEMAIFTGNMLFYRKGDLFVAAGWNG